MLSLYIQLERRQDGLIVDHSAGMLNMADPQEHAARWKPFGPPFTRPEIGNREELIREKANLAVAKTMQRERATNADVVK